MEVTEPLLQIPVTKVIYTELTAISILVLNCIQSVYINFNIFSFVKWMEKVVALVTRENNFSLPLMMQISNHLFFFYQNTQISDTDPSRSMGVDHTIHIMTKQHPRSLEYTLAAQSKDELNKWWDGLQQHLLDQGLYTTPFLFSSVF